MNPVDFVGLRAAVLNRMGEHAVTRRWCNKSIPRIGEPLLTKPQSAAYIGTSRSGRRLSLRSPAGLNPTARSITLNGRCFPVDLQRPICGRRRAGRIAIERGVEPPDCAAIDVLLARRFAGAAGRAQHAVQIEWEGVDTLNPWRFAMANAVGETIPDALLEQDDPFYARARCRIGDGALQSRAQVPNARARRAFSPRRQWLISTARSMPTNDRRARCRSGRTVCAPPMSRRTRLAGLPQWRPSGGRGRGPIMGIGQTC